MLNLIFAALLSGCTSESKNEETATIEETAVVEESPIHWEDCSYRIGEHICNVQLTDSDMGSFDLYEHYGKPIVIQLAAEWCGPCKQISPILEEIASNEDNKVTIAKINIDENPRVATDYGIRSIPTMLLFNNGELKDTKVGALPKQELNDWIKNNS